MSIQSLALIKFEVKGDTRTVTSASAAGSIGGLVNGMSKSGPSDKEQQAFTSELVKPGVYKLTLTKPLEPGAYAFVNGAYYDFDILPPQYCGELQPVLKPVLAFLPAAAHLAFGPAGDLCDLLNAESREVMHVDDAGRISICFFQLVHELSDHHEALRGRGC